MSQNDDDDNDNPFAPPESDLDSRSPRKKSPIERVKGKVMAPAIALIIVGSLGLIMSIVNVVVAIASGPAILDPNAPEFVRNFQQASVGPLAIVVQGRLFCSTPRSSVAEFKCCDFNRACLPSWRPCLRS